LAPVDRGFGPNAERAEADHSVPLFICDPEDEAHEIAMRRAADPGLFDGDMESDCQLRVDESGSAAVAELGRSPLCKRAFAQAP
jgi:hypothetical protein